MGTDYEEKTRIRFLEEFTRVFGKLNILPDDFIRDIYTTFIADRLNLHGIVLNKDSISSLINSHLQNKAVELLKTESQSEDLKILKQWATAYSKHFAELSQQYLPSLAA